MTGKVLKNMIFGGLLGVFLLNLFFIFSSSFYAMLGISKYTYILKPFEEISQIQVIGVMTQMFAVLFMGAMIALCLSIRKLEQWSLAKQMLLQYITFAIGLFPFCFFMMYIERTVLGCIKYLLIIALIYAVIFAVEYVALKVNIREINENLIGKPHNRKIKFLPYIVLLIGIYYVVPVLYAIGMGMDWNEATFATNLYNYFVYPFVILGIGIFAGIKLRINWIMPVSSGALIIPVSLLLYQEISYTIQLAGVMAVCATIGTLIGWGIGAALRKGGVSI
ncbi:MAG: DUF3021 family protein [bacterium]|nr:DUF3021 family protein [bacterium]